MKPHDRRTPNADRAALLGRVWELRGWLKTWDGTVDNGNYPYSMRFSTGGFDACRDGVLKRLDAALAGEPQEEKDA